MSASEFFYIGKIQKTFGNQGNLMVLLEPEIAETELIPESVFLEIEGERIPFFIETWEYKPGNKVLVRFEDYSSPESAAKLSGSKIYLTESPLQDLPEDEFYFHEIIGYQVIDNQFGKIGELTDVLELPQQTLLQIMNGGKEILIPLVDEIVTGVNKKRCIIYIDAPEGLISLYLG